MEAADIPGCAALACDSEIGRRYGFEPGRLGERIRTALEGGVALFFVAEAASQPWAIDGFAWVEPRGAFGGAPYLKLIAVETRARGRGTGAALMEAWENATRGIGHMHTLLVSDFNLGAQEFYRRLGYHRAGELPDFAVAGITEVLMIKPHD